MKQTLINLSKRGNFSKITLDRNSYNQLMPELVKYHIKTARLAAVEIDGKVYRIEVENFYGNEIFIKFE